MMTTTRPTATCWYRDDCRRWYVRQEAPDGLVKDEWVFDFAPDGRLLLRAMFHSQRVSRRRKWGGVMARCWFANATGSERDECLAIEAVPLPHETLGPLVAWVEVRWVGQEGER